MTPNEGFLEYAGLLTKFTDLAIGQRNRLIREGIDERIADQICAQLLVILLTQFLNRTKP